MIRLQLNVSASPKITTVVRAPKPMRYLITFILSGVFFLPAAHASNMNQCQHLLEAAGFDLNTVAEEVSSGHEIINLMSQAIIKNAGYLNHVYDKTIRKKIPTPYTAEEIRVNPYLKKFLEKSFVPWNAILTTLKALRNGELDRLKPKLKEHGLFSEFDIVLALELRKAQEKFLKDVSASKSDAINIAKEELLGQLGDKRGNTIYKEFEHLQAMLHGGGGLYETSILENGRVPTPLDGDLGANYRDRTIDSRFPHAHLISLFVARHWREEFRSAPHRHVSDILETEFKLAIKIAEDLHLKQGNDFSMSDVFNEFTLGSRTEISQNGIILGWLKYPQWRVWDNDDLKRFIRLEGEFAPTKATDPWAE